MTTRSGIYVPYIPVNNKSLGLKTKDRNVAIQELYESFKETLFKLIIGYFRDTQNEFKDGEVILIIDMGKTKTPTLNLDKGKEDTWSLEQTLNQYINGVKSGGINNINLPGFAVNETLRYLHTNPNTQKFAITEINDNTSFKPVLANKICKGDAYIVMNSIIPGDSKFIDKINMEITKFNPKFKLVTENVNGSDKSIIINNNKLTLSSSFINLVLRVRDHSSNGSVRRIKLLQSQDDEKRDKKT
jgi:hypothetical protein